MALSERTLSKLADVGAKADEAFQSGRVVWVEGPGMTWGGDADEVLALLVEKVEQQGWHRSHVSNGPTEGVNNLAKRIKRVGGVIAHKFLLRGLI